MATDDDRVVLRVRHGIRFDPVLGMYRAVREVNGKREWIGPWTTEQRAQANADEATRIFHEVLDEHGTEKAKGDTPLGLWIPT